MKHALLRHKFLIAIWLVVFGIGGYSTYILFFKSTGGENPYVLSSNSTQQSTEAVKSQPKQAEKGQAMQDGDLEITVKDLTCNNERTIGENAYSMAEAEGHFCRLSITVKNLGQAPTNLPLSAQKAQGAKDEPLKVQTDATQYAQTDQTKGYWYENIPPGKTVSGDLIFDVNGSETIEQIELHGAENSPGIAVKL